MAGEKALDGETDPLALDDGVIDDAVGDLRDVLKKDAGGEPAPGDESVDAMGGAAAFGSDFGSDFAEGGAEDDPFNIGDTPGFDAAEAGADFGGGMDAAGSDFGGGAGLDFDAGAGAGTGAEVKFGASGATNRVDLVLGIPVDVQIILGSSRMAVSSLMNLEEGATIALDRKIGEPVEIVVNGKMIGRGEITVMETDETRFAIRIIEVIGAQQKKSS